MAKTLLIDFSKLKDLYTGLGQVCFHLAKQFEKYMPQSIETHFFVPKKYVGAFGDRFYYHELENKFKRFFLYRKRFDIWHCPHHTFTHLPKHRKTKLIYTVNDLNPLYGKRNAAYEKFARLFPQVLKRVDYMTTISAFTQQDIKRRFDPPCPIEVVYLGVDIDPVVIPKKPKQLLFSDFLFTLCAVTEKKNTMALIDLLSKIPTAKLVIAGSYSDHHYVESILQRAKAFGLENRVQFLGEVSDAEKYWLYQECRAFVFPSKMEGFGLPVIEAMRFGKPVFISNLTALPEVGGPEAYYWESFEPDKMADVFNAGMADYRMNSDKAARIKAWSEQFTWEAAAKKYIALYRRF